MYFKELELVNFRNYESLKIGFHEKVNILLGENAHTTKECGSLASFERTVKLNAAVMRALFANPELVR